MSDTLRLQDFNRLPDRPRAVELPRVHRRAQAEAAGLPVRAREGGGRRRLLVAPHSDADHVVLPARRGALDDLLHPFDAELPHPVEKEAQPRPPLPLAAPCRTARRVEDFIGGQAAGASEDDRGTEHLGVADVVVLQATGQIVDDHREILRPAQLRTQAAEVLQKIREIAVRVETGQPSARRVVGVPFRHARDPQERGKPDRTFQMKVDLRLGDAARKLAWIA